MRLLVDGKQITELHDLLYFLTAHEAIFHEWKSLPRKRDFCVPLPWALMCPWALMKFPKVEGADSGSELVQFNKRRNETFKKGFRKNPLRRLTIQHHVRWKYRTWAWGNGENLPVLYNAMAQLCTMPWIYWKNIFRKGGKASSAEHRPGNFCGRLKWFGSFWSLCHECQQLANAFSSFTSHILMKYQRGHSLPLHVAWLFSLSWPWGTTRRGSFPTQDS